MKVTLYFYNNFIKIIRGKLVSKHEFNNVNIKHCISICLFSFTDSLQSFEDVSAKNVSMLLVKNVIMCETIF